MTELNLDTFSTPARSVLERAQNLARKRQHRQIEHLHALISLLLLEEGKVPAALKAAGVSVDNLLPKLQDELGLLPRSYNAQARLEVTHALVQDIDAARAAARAMGSPTVEPEHLLIAFSEASRGMAGRLLREHGVTPEALRKQLGGAAPAAATPPPAAGGRKGPGQSAIAAAIPTSAPLKIDLLTQHGRDMTAMAEQGLLDPVIGREDEIRRLMQVLTRRTKNNPVLVGQPGVGKTAVVEALCMRLVAGDVPKGLQGVRIFSLDMGSLVAGTSLRGQFEERLKGIVDEIRNSQGRVIVYIDEIHLMVAAGGNDSGGNAANLLKPALARGELRCIGTTTQEEYKAHIEEDKALVRRFQTIAVEESTVDQAIAILRGVKPKYEIHHRVRITDAALVASARLSQRYLHDRALPDKAIDLIDEAAARLRLEIDSKPTEVDTLDRRIQSLEIQRAALQSETTAEAREELTRLDSEIGRLNQRVQELDGHWKQEKEGLDKITELKEILEETDQNIEKARREGDKFRVAELTHSVKARLEADILAEEQRLNKLLAGVRLLKQDVEPGDVANVISDITGIPVAKMMEGEREKILKMSERLNQRVVGQDPAIRSISRAVQRNRAGVSNPNQPIGTFLFVGPTGVGKTELAKALAEFLFDSEDALIRIDMSEYQEQAKVNTLIGSARGYVGSEKGGVLTEAVRHKPYSVVLFDEAEKAHPKVFDLLLQVLDEGRLTDSQGLKVDFTNTIVIMTSNVGSRQILDMTGQLDNAQMEDQVKMILRDHFRPEFLNRIQDIVVFNALDLRAIELIVNIQVKKLRRILAEQKLDLDMSEDARQWIAQQGYEPEYGARPLQRAMLTHVQDPLALELLQGRFSPGDTIAVDYDEAQDGLSFKAKG